MKITEKEKELLEQLVELNHGDGYNCSEGYVYFELVSVCDHTGLEIKETRGVLASLIKKGVICTEEIEHDIQYFSYDYQGE